MIPRRRTAEAPREGARRGPTGRLRLAAAAGIAAGTIAAWTAPSRLGSLTGPEAPTAARPLESLEGPTDASPSAASPPPSQCLAPERAEPANPPGEPARVYAKTRFVWIREEPSWGSQWIGYLWAGGSVALASPKPVYARGCSTWYRIVPRGYVCVDGERATLDPDDAGFRTVRERAGDYESPSPHRYAESLGAERYTELPEAQLQAAREPGLSAHLDRVRAARQEGRVHPLLSGVDLTPAPLDAVVFSSLPVDVQVQRHTLKRRSAIAYLSEHQHEGRSFLLTADLAWVPKDRVRPYPPVTFRGVHLDGSVRLPIALFRGQDRAAYRRGTSGALEPAGERFRRLDWVPLTGNAVTAEGGRFLETAREGLWVRDTDAVVPAPSAATPWGARTLEPDASAERPPGRATWVEVSIHGGWLIAYEGTYPVFTTLISPGIGGAVRPGRDPLESSASPTGHYRVTGKFVTATMDAPTELVHAEVPWVQNFFGPYALHGAYWHDAWGERKSGGCINLSPVDGKWLFEWTEPRVPPGWHGVRWEPSRSDSTAVWLHR
jgi:hypothetical protein